MTNDEYQRGVGIVALMAPTVAYAVMRHMRWEESSMHLPEGLAEIGLTWTEADLETVEAEARRYPNVVDWIEATRQDPDGTLPMSYIFMGALYND